jgi:lactate 2-monooxygenase
VELGIDAMIVSNHGGRQIDNAIASLDALVSIREAVGPQPTISCSIVASDPELMC